MKPRQGTAGRYAKALFMIARAAGTAERRRLGSFEDAVRQFRFVAAAALLVS